MASPHPQQGNLGSGSSSNMKNGVQNPESEDNSVQRRGVKRPRSGQEMATCDCDEMPLSKRINNLNLRQQQMPENGLTEQQHSFEDNYTFGADSHYYSSNHLLYHLHMERMQRHSARQPPNYPQPPSS